MGHSQLEPAGTVQLEPISCSLACRVNSSLHPPNFVDLCYTIHSVFPMGHWQLEPVGTSWTYWNQILAHLNRSQVEYYRAHVQPTFRRIYSNKDPRSLEAAIEVTPQVSKKLVPTGSNWFQLVQLLVTH